ncbi:MAG: mycothiol transferase, partial [Acidimicrobiales bacterium]
LTLAGLIKHLALVEDTWFVERMDGRPRPEPWLSAPFDDDPDWDFHSATDDTPDELLALYRAACDRSRAVVAGHDDLGALSVAQGRGDEGHFSLRWILLHMIEETARHNGHADLLRESIDGLTGE